MGITWWLNPTGCSLLPYLEENLTIIARVVWPITHPLNPRSSELAVLSSDRVTSYPGRAGLERNALAQAESAWYEVPDSSCHSFSHRQHSQARHLIQKRHRYVEGWFSRLYSTNPHHDHSTGKTWNKESKGLYDLPPSKSLRLRTPSPVQNFSTDIHIPSYAVIVLRPSLSPARVVSRRTSMPNRSRLQTCGNQAVSSSKVIIGIFYWPIDPLVAWKRLRANSMPFKGALNTRFLHIHVTWPALWSHLQVNLLLQVSILHTVGET